MWLIRLEGGMEVGTKALERNRTHASQSGVSVSFCQVSYWRQTSLTLPRAAPSLLEPE